MDQLAIAERKDKCMLVARYEHPPYSTQSAIIPLNRKRTIFAPAATGRTLSGVGKRDISAWVQLH